jgi:glycosyltransferase involved in cell wall biosynthesis
VRDIDPGKAKELFGYDADDTVVVEPGYVRELKGTHLFVDAAERLSDSAFLVAGGAQDESAESYLEALRDRAPANVRITGHLDDRRFHAAFVAADVVCLPYLQMTQSGIFNWCAAYHVPVVAADHEYFVRLREEYDCVELFDPDDPGSIADAIEGLLSSLDRRETLRLNLAAFSDEHSFARVAENHRDLYRELTA